MNVKLTWTDRNTNETGHRIYRSSSPMDTAALPPPVAELGPDVTEWEDTDTPVDQVVYYIVSAVRGAEEAFSDEVMIDTGATYDPHWDNVVSLLHFDGDLTDETGRIWTPIGSPAFADTAPMLDGKYLTQGGVANSDIILGAEDFTIECFFRVRSTSSYIFLWDGRGAQGGDGPYPIVYMQGSDMILRNHVNSGTTGPVSSVSVALNTSYHFAHVRKSGVSTFYLAGVNVGSAEDATNYNLRSLNVAYKISSFGSVDMDEFRITKGVARYTEDFTPPTEPFPNFGPPPEPTPTLPTVIGETYGGGFYAGDIESDGQWYKLIVADVSADITDTNSRWKTTDDNTPNTDHLTDGVANTSAMIAAGIELHPAANHCIDHRGGGNADWYMPAKDELNVIYQNLGYNRPNCPPDFQSGGPQAFSNAWYWASTQYSSIEGWLQHFSDGSQSYGIKYYTTLRVRPIRRIAFTP